MYAHSVLGLDKGILMEANLVLTSLKKQVTALEKTMSFLPAVPLQAVSTTTVRGKKPPKGKEKKGRTSCARKDSLMHTNVYPCEQLHDSQIGLNTEATGCCPICQMDCIYHTRLKI
jgi:hypothetical protein